MFKCINISLQWYCVNVYAFSLRAFFGLLLVAPLEQWGVDKCDLAQVIFPYLKIIPAFFQPNPCSYLAGYCIHIFVYI